jgi:hypothetical protein
MRASACAGLAIAGEPAVGRHPPMSLGCPATQAHWGRELQAKGWSGARESQDLRTGPQHLSIELSSLIVMSRHPLALGKFFSPTQRKNCRQHSGMREELASEKLKETCSEPYVPEQLHGEIQA